MSAEGEKSQKRLCLDDASVQSTSEKETESLANMPLETKEDICNSASVICHPMGEILDSVSDDRSVEEAAEEMDITVEPSEVVTAKCSKELAEDKTAKRLKDSADRTSIKEAKESEMTKGRKRKLDNDNGLSDESPAVEVKVVDSSLQMEEETKILVEEDVGVTEFISQHAGFSGTIKQRYSDFIVNEIDKDGETVHLTDLSWINKTADSDVATDSNLKELVSEENVLQLQRLLETKSLTDEVLIPAGNDKELRGRLHAAIKTDFPDLNSNTIDRNGEKFIQIRFRSKKDQRRQNIWKKSTGDYCKFVLYKENKDTLEAISIISKFLRVSPQCFSFAGTKDRRAKTSQDITAYRIEPSRLLHLNNCLRNMSLGNFRLCKQPLKLGDLLGNRFTILLRILEELRDATTERKQWRMFIRKVARDPRFDSTRNVLGSDEEIEKGLASLRDHGFINYYGMQRFGTTRIPTHHVGRALLCGKWSEAVELILKPREGDRDEVSKARATWWSTRNAEKALKELKGHQCMERKLLEGLKKYAKNDLVSALSWIPCKMRLMYIHSYQSYIWNHVVSRRMKRFGAHPMIGDLAMCDPVVEEDLEEPEVEETAAEESVLPAKTTKPLRPEPVEVTEDNLSKFKLADIVLPLPGYDVRYPQNEVKSWYEEFLKKDGMDDLNFKSKVRDYSLPGGYRKIVVQPEHVAWETMHYNDYQVSLVHGDMEALKKEELLPQVSDGKFKAIKLKLSLPSSSYATMALREVLKSGTSAAYHTTLNVT